MSTLRKWWTLRQFKRRWIAAVKNGHGQPVVLDHIPPADPIAYIWRNPATGEEWTLDPQDVAVVYPGPEHAARALCATLTPRTGRTVPVSAPCPHGGRGGALSPHIRFGPGPPPATHTTHNRIDHYLNAAEGITLGVLLALIVLTTGGIL